MTTLFFCGIGGSGMMPLAFLLKAQGINLCASDRAFDQGRTPEKFVWLERQGICLFPQDGSGLTPGVSALVVSSAVEETIPDVKAARALNIPIRKRAEMLAELANAAPQLVAVGGTSGKTTTTGMTGYLLREGGLAPSLMNGGILVNYTTDNPYCSWLSGIGPFVSEVDESDGSIALYQPDVAVLTNISLDHKSLAELRGLFGDFIGKARRAVVNVDDPEVHALVADRPHTGLELAGFGLENPEADLRAVELQPRADGIDATLLPKGEAPLRLSLQVPGQHNVANALAALLAAEAAGLPLARGAEILSGFRGIRRRLETIGQRKDVTVVDDFAHNPDKIRASLATLKAFPGRLLVMFQPHGFGPLRLMRNELVETFATLLGAEDRLYMPEPYYAGGTVDRSVGSREIVGDLKSRGVVAEVFAARDEILPRLTAEARPGDRVLIMGARDDTLTDFARAVLASL